MVKNQYPDPDEQPKSYFPELRNNFGVKILKFFDADLDPGSGICFEPKSGIRDPHSGSATLELSSGLRARCTGTYQRKCFYLKMV